MKKEKRKKERKREKRERGKKERRVPMRGSNLLCSPSNYCTASGSLPNLDFYDPTMAALAPATMCCASWLAHRLPHSCTTFGFDSLQTFLLKVCDL